MVIHDISVPVSNTMPVYLGDPPVIITRTHDMTRGDKLNLSKIDMGAHTGTHLDAPLHFIRDGISVDQIDLRTLVGPAQVVDLTNVGDAIHARDFERAQIPTGAERIICKTRNSALWNQAGFQKNFVAFAADAADWLVARGVKLIGIDYLSAEIYGAEPQAHAKLCGAGVIIVEGLNLKNILAGAYTLVCLPINLQGAEGAPARAILIER